MSEVNTLKIGNSELYTIHSVLKAYNICIPIMQREYVHGVTKKDCGLSINVTKLIDDVIESLVEDTEINLNIVYGFDDGSTFYPTDGQQRLTLLYIIYWYIFVISGNGQKLTTYKEFTYETRESSKEFLLFLRNSNESLWIHLFKEFNTVNKKEKSPKNLLDIINQKEWFKVSWNNDITIKSIINVLEYIDNKIGENNAKTLFHKLINDTTKIKLSIISEKKDDPEFNANINYVRLNARGKELEEFENAKALLDIIEEQIEGESLYNFAYNYDSKYIDVFYNMSTSNDLYLKTKEINEKTIDFLINSYNFMCIFFDESPSTLSHSDYYYILLEKSKEKSKEDPKEESKEKNIVSDDLFWKTYVNFIKIILDYCYNSNEMISHIEEVFITNNLFVEGKKILPKTFIYLMYLYLYKDEHKINYLEKFIEKLDYHLDFLRYDEWKDVGFTTTKKLAKVMVKNLDLIDFFCLNAPEIIIENLELNDVTVYNKLDIVDIKVRIKELCIRSKIIKRIGNEEELKTLRNEHDYDYFKHRKIFTQNTKIFYLLYVSEMWDEEVDNTKILAFNNYLTMLSDYIFEDNLELKKWFTIATYYDEAINKLKTPNEINALLNYKNYVYINGTKVEIANQNLHSWSSKYYEIKDNDEEKDIYERKYKLNILRKAYKLLLEYSSDENKKWWLFSQFDAAYDNYWLKYAISRNYIGLFDNVIHYKSDEDIQYLNLMDSSMSIFMWIHAIDIGAFSINLYYSNCYEYYTTNVKETKSMQAFVRPRVYGSVANNKQLNILWEDESIKYFYKRRDFYYYKHYVQIGGNNNTLLSFINNSLCFDYFKQNSYSRYKFDLNEFIKSKDKEIINYNNVVNYINKKINENTDFYMYGHVEVEKEIKNNFTLIYEYNTKGEQKNKYSFKNCQSKVINASEYIPTGNLAINQTLEYEWDKSKL